jgi:GNAT superfamily N-acetyltransferase
MPKSSLPLFQVDAFTDRPFAGNPAAVCLLSESRDNQWLQAVAQEMNLSETAFLLPEGNDYLHHLAVSPVHRRQGIGRALVEVCLAGLGSIGIPKCNIFLYADNESGEAFWKQNGWNERSDLKVLQKATTTETL